MSTVALKRICGLTTDAGPDEERPAVALEHVGGGTGKLREDAELPRRGAAAGFAAVGPGDVLFGKLRPYLAKTLRVREPMFASTELLALRPAEGVDSRWLHYLVMSDPMVGWAVATSDGSKMPRTSWGALGEYRVTVPERGLQRTVADFLDAETTRIDALIAKKRQLVERLHQRLGIEHERSVLGLDQAQESSTNGKFYGATAWPETALRHLNCEVQTGPFGSQLHADDYAKNGWPIVNPSNIIGGRVIALPEMSVDDETRARLARHVLRSGDIVFGRRGEMGRAGLISECEDGWLCGTGSLRLRLSGKRLSPEYLTLLLQTRAAKRYFQLSSVGSTMENLNTEILLALPVLVPPRETQTRVVSRINRLRAHDSKLETKLPQSVKLLIEHRQALITAAVTGQLEVPGVAA